MGGVPPGACRAYAAWGAGSMLTRVSLLALPSSQRSPRAVGGFPSLRQVPGQTRQFHTGSQLGSPLPRAAGRGQGAVGDGPAGSTSPAQHFTEHTNMLSRETVLQNFSAWAVGQAAATKGTAPWSEQGPPPHLAAPQVGTGPLGVGRKGRDGPREGRRASGAEQPPLPEEGGLRGGASPGLR